MLTDEYYVYVCQHDGVDASKTRLPDGVGRYCNKAVSNTSVFLQQYEDHPTHELHLTDLHHVNTLHHKGMLRGLLHPSTLIYRLKRADDDYTITLLQPDGDIILQPPPGRKWDWGLSVCCSGAFIIVVSSTTRSMDVFSQSGNILLLFYRL